MAPPLALGDAYPARMGPGARRVRFAVPLPPPGPSPAAPVQISAVIIARNEAARIGPCLATLQGVADEIIVLDSGSTDGTQALCRAAGARVLDVPWQGYAATKNAGNALAAHPYVLSMDADEALSPALRQSLLALKAAPTPPATAWAMARLTFYGDTPVRHCGWYPDTKVRLFPRQAAHWAGDYVHEALCLAPGLRVARLGGDLLHHSIADIEAHLAQINRYSTLAAEAAHAAGRRASWAKTLLGPPWRFVRMYVFRLGFLDGRVGFLVCLLSAWALALRQLKLRELQARPQAAPGR